MAEIIQWPGGKKRKTEEPQAPGSEGQSVSVTRLDNLRVRRESPATPELPQAGETDSVVEAYSAMRAASSGERESVDIDPALIAHFDKLVAFLTDLQLKDSRALNETNIDLRMGATDDVTNILNLVAQTSKFDWQREPSKANALCRAVSVAFTKQSREGKSFPDQLSAIVLRYEMFSRMLS